MSKTDTRPKDDAETAEPEVAEDTAADEETKAEDKAEAGEPEKAKAEKKPAEKGPAEKEPAEKKPAEEEPAGKVAVTKDGGAGETGRAAWWRRVPGKAWPVRATVAVAVVGSAVTAGLQWHEADQAAQRDAERTQVRASAAEFGQALLSYDHTKLRDARNHVLSLASDDFAKTYDEAFTGGLEGVITKLKADATATVRTVYLGEIESETAKAVVVMDSEVHSTAGTRRVLGSYLDMRLVRRGGEWKVTDVTSVGAANESMTDPDGNQQDPGKAVPTPKPSN
ncbi:hypothetical protein AB0C74_32315 [Spirillospora sp. NPDC048832]